MVFVKCCPDSVTVTLTPGRTAPELSVAVPEMREASSDPRVHGTAAYNLACVRAQQGRVDEAMESLEEAFKLRPDMKASAPNDSDLAALRDDPRFQELVKS